VAGRLNRPLEPTRFTDVNEAASGEGVGELTAVEALPILAVDDVVENLRALEAVLEPLGHPLRTATSGHEALRLLLEQEFALILLDVRMPGLDGIETAQLIKGRDRTRDIPIVFLTAARDEIRDIIRGYGVGAVDYVLKPFDAELLRSKVAVFVELESGRRSLKRSEAFLRGAFDAAPIGKTVLDGDRTIIRSNPAFARMVGREPAELQGLPIAELCRAEDRPVLADTLDRVSRSSERDPAANTASVDLRLRTGSGSQVWTGVVASAIESADPAESLLLAQWVDLSVRRRAEQARAELLVEQAARAQAEALTERLEKLQTLTDATETLALDELLPEFARRLAELLDAEVVEIEVSGEGEETTRARATDGGRAWLLEAEDPGLAGDGLAEEPLRIERSRVGVLRLVPRTGREFTATERSLLHDGADRAALAITRAQLHEEEHRIAVMLQRGLLPKSVPTVDGVQLAVHYEAAGIEAEVGGDWYDTFVLPGARLGIVLGDVAGRSIPAASTMGQLRTVTRAFALMDEGYELPGEVLTRLSRYQTTLGANELFTIVYVVIDPATGTIAWASAGHPPALIRTAAGAGSYLQGGDGLIGIGEPSYRTLTREVAEGDVLILYTDGLVERRGEALDAGLDRLERAARGGPDEPQALCHHILEEILPQDERLADDVTALLARISPRPDR
jgi:PAS domain S-box-containing protein